MTSPASIEYFVPVEVPMLAFVGASKSIDSLPILEWRNIRPIQNARPHDRYCAGRVSGNSLWDDGIHDGDIAIFKLNFEIDEIKPGRLVAVLTPCGLLLKHVYITLDNQVRLVSSNPVFEDMVFDIDDVEIQGVVVRIERDF